MRPVAVIIPTVAGREDELLATTRAFHRDARVRVYPQYGHTTVGAGWTAGVEELLNRVDVTARRDGVETLLPHYVLLANDDMPPHDGWLDPAIEAVDKGFTPCPVMYRPDGSVESAGSWEATPLDWRTVTWTPLCFFRLAEWSMVGPIPPIHYYSDNWFATASIYRAGRPITVRTAFAFTHTWAMPGRKSLTGPEAAAARVLWQEFERECKRTYPRRGKR